MNSSLCLSSIFANLVSEDGKDLLKVSFIRKMPKGYWGVFSKKNKLLGKYKTRAEAVKRLSQIEFFKHKNASKEKIDTASYSEMMREVSKKYGKDILRELRKTFKNAFDQAVLNEDKNPEEKGLAASLEFIDGLEQNIDKVASAIEMGDPQYAGKYIAEMIKFIMRRISPEKRPHSLNGLKQKIHSLDEFVMGSKKMPASSAIGQSINLTKQLLLSHSPNYIRAVINSIVSNL